MYFQSLFRPLHLGPVKEKVLKVRVSSCNASVDVGMQDFLSLERKQHQNVDQNETKCNLFGAEMIFQESSTAGSAESCS